jgi:hypothetical protein
MTRGRCVNIGMQRWSDSSIRRAGNASDYANTTLTEIFGCHAKFVRAQTGEIGKAYCIFLQPILQRSLIGGRQGTGRKAADK